MIKWFKRRGSNTCASARVEGPRPVARSKATDADQLALYQCGGLGHRVKPGEDDLLRYLSAYGVKPGDDGLRCTNFARMRLCPRRAYFFSIFQ